MWLARLSVRRPVLVTMLIGFLVVFGLVSWPRMPVELLPEVGIPYLMVRVVWPGAGPQDVQTGVLLPLEEALGRVNHLKTLRSSAVPDAAVVVLELASGSDVDAAVEQVKGILEEVDAKLPPSAWRPVVKPIDLNAAPVFQVAVLGGPGLSRVALTDWVEDHVQVPWSRLDGVASVDVVGQQDREVAVEVDQGLLLSHRLTLGHVVEAVRAGGIEVPSGTLEGTREAVPVRLANAYGSADDVRRAMIRGPLGDLLTVDQVARVVDGVAPEETRARWNGQPCVGIAVFKKAGANTVALGHALGAALEEARGAGAAQGITLALVHEAASSIEASVADLVVTMGLCVLLTAVILWLFLHDWRGTLIISLSIPASVVASLSFLHLQGHTLNYMTLMGLAISIGSLVDASIVVLESIDRHAETTPDAREAVATGTGRVVLGVIGSIVTNIAVFAPVVFLRGIVGSFFVPFALAIVWSMALSLLISFTLTPMLAAWLYRRSAGQGARLSRDPVSRAWDAGFTWFAGLYRAGIRWSIRHRYVAAVAFLVLFAAAAGLLGPTVSMGMFQSPDQGFFVIQVVMPRGTSLQATSRAVARAEAVLQASPRIEHVYSEIGRYNTLFGTLNARNRAELHVTVRDAPDRPSTTDILGELRPALAASVPGAHMTLKELGSGESAVRDDFMVDLFGPDPAVLATLAERVERVFEAQPNVVDIQITGSETSPQVRVVPWPDRVARAGLDPAKLGLLLRVAVEGDTEARLRVGDETWPVRVRLREEDRRDVVAVAATTVQTATGAQVPLRELARVEQVDAPSVITRQDRESRAVVTANLAWGAIGDTAASVEEALSREPLPDGYRIRIGGEEEQRSEAAAEIGMAFALALVLIYMLLAGMLESFVHPLTILTTVPFGGIGVLVAIAATGVVMDIFGLMALVMLVGIVVNNAILMIEETRHLVTEGHPLAFALEEGAMRRLRAILMTSLATAVGMLPLALGWGEGAEVRQAMAIVSMGGVGVSSVLILVACPAFYHIVEDVRGALGGSSDLSR